MNKVSDKCIGCYWLYKEYGEEGECMNKEDCVHSDEDE